MYVMHVCAVRYVRMYVRYDMLCYVMYVYCVMYVRFLCMGCMCVC